MYSLLLIIFKLQNCAHAYSYSRMDETKYINNLIQNVN